MVYLAPSSTNFNSGAILEIAASKTEVGQRISLYLFLLHSQIGRFLSLTTAGIFFRTFSEFAKFLILVEEFSLSQTSSY